MNKRWLDEIERAIQQLKLPSEPKSLYDPLYIEMGHIMILVH